MTEQSDKIRRGLPQFYSKSVIVDRFNSDVLGLDRHKFFALNCGLDLRVQIGTLFFGGRHCQPLRAVEKFMKFCSAVGVRRRLCPICGSFFEIALEKESSVRVFYKNKTRIVRFSIFYVVTQISI